MIPSTVTSSRNRRLAFGLLLLGASLACDGDPTAPTGTFVGQWGGGDMQLVALHDGAELDIPCAYVATHQGVALDEANTFTFRGRYITSQMLVHPPMATVTGTAGGDSVVVTLQVDGGVGFFQTLFRGAAPVRDSTMVCAL